MISEVLHHTKQMKKDIIDLLENKYWTGNSGYNCAQTVLMCMMEYYEKENDLWQNIAAPFGGGLCGSHISVCGAISGGLMVIGIMDKENKSKTGAELLEFVKSKYGYINCDKILDINFDDEDQVTREKSAKSRTICLPMIKDICLWLADRYAA